MPYEASASAPVPVPLLQQSLHIAMHYLQQTGQAFPISQTQNFCSDVIFEEWKHGRRHPVWLANKAIVALERAREAHWSRILYDPVTASR
jgi:hypothetical protein